MMYAELAHSLQLFLHFLVCPQGVNHSFIEKKKKTEETKQEQQHTSKYYSTKTAFTVLV